MGVRLPAHPRKCGENGGSIAVPLTPTAHPRKCGENRRSEGKPMPRGGSSPQVRGTYFKYIVGDHGIGLIPAGAGNIYQVWAEKMEHMAHPRRCGEHHRIRRHMLKHRGSSPQVRGTLVFGVFYVDGGGLIPAGAGNIGGLESITLETGAHPRRCGEHTM